MSFVRTLLGDIRPEQLGFTYAHEHLVCRPPYWAERGEHDLLLDDADLTARDVEDFARAGGRTIVDATAVDYGRDVAAVAAISERAGVHVIGTAGFNKSFLWSAALPVHLRRLVGSYETYGQWIEDADVRALAAFVEREVEQGMEGTSWRAGQIKFGTGYNAITPLEEKTLRAAARAHHATGAPIHSHTEAGTMVLEQIELLKREGVDLRHVSFGHMDRNPDPWVHAKAASTGAYLCFDGIGKIKYAPESTRIQCILELVRGGFEDQILISGDTARKSYYRHYAHGPGLAYIAEKWVPRFREEAERAGLDGDRLIRKFFVDNPARCFTFKRQVW